MSMHHHSGQNVVDCASRVHNKFDYCDEAYSFSIRVDYATPHSICFLPQHQRQQRNRCQDLLPIENTVSDLKVLTLHYANELLVLARLSFQKLLQTHSTYRNNKKKMFGKRVMMHTHCR